MRIPEWKHGAEARRRAQALATPAAPPAEALAVRFRIDCAADAEAVLGRVQAVLGAVLAADAEAWPGVEAWRDGLPSEFVDRCAPEVTEVEARRRLAAWQRMSLADRARQAATEPWSLSDWLFWMHPDERPWGLWSVTVAGADRLEATVLLEGWPAPWGALWWLFVGCGARSVTPAEDAS